MAQVVREVHSGHAAGAEFTLDAVAAAKGSGESLERRNHAA
jgi:hypothetical protein